MLDTHELDRRPGTLRTVSLCEPAPPDLRTEVIGVPEGADLTLDLRLESVLDGILVSGTVQALAIGECARCLGQLERTLVVDIQELFAYPSHESEDTSIVEGELIDLEPTVRDALVIDLPLAPVCRADCPGLCPECGELLAEDPGHSHDAVDPRWAALRGYDGALRADGTAGGNRTDTDIVSEDIVTEDIVSGDPLTPSIDDRPGAGGPEES